MFSPGKLGAGLAIVAAAAQSMSALEASPARGPFSGDPAIRYHAVEQRRFLGGRAMDESTRTEIEAAAFRRLVGHLRERSDVQNIDIMDLAGFCRNCLAKWYRAAAEERGDELDYDDARAIIYGMPYADWKAKYQTPRD